MSFWIWILIWIGTDCVCLFGRLNAQAALEVSVGLPVTVMRVSTPLEKASMEVGFMAFIVRPLYDTLVCAVPDLEPLMARVVRTPRAHSASALRERTPRTHSASALRERTFCVVRILSARLARSLGLKFADLGVRPRASQDASVAMWTRLKKEEEAAAAAQPRASAWGPAAC